MLISYRLNLNSYCGWPRTKLKCDNSMETVKANPLEEMQVAYL